MLTALEANMSGIKDKTSIAEISVSDLRKTFSELETEMTNSGGKVPLTDEWLVKYRELMSTVTSATKQVDALKKAEASDNSQTQKQANYYSTILSNYREIYSLKQKLLTAGKEETKVIQEQIRSLNSSNASINKQLGKQGLKDSNWQTQVDDLKEELDYSLRISEARQKDKANQSSLNNAQREAIQIVEELEQAYQKVQDIKIKIASLDKTKDGEKISTLSQEEESAQAEYKQLYDRLRKRKNYDKESWNETKTAIDSATQSAIEYNNSRAQDTLNKAQKTEVSNFNILKDKWEEQGVLVGEFKTKVENMESALASVGSEGELDNLKLQIKDLRTEADKIAKVNEIQLSLDNGHGVSEYQNRIQSLINDFERYGVTTDKAEKETAQLNTILASMKTASGQDLINLADKLETEFKNVKISLDSAKLSYDKFLQPVSNEKASSLIVRINSFLTKNTAITAEAKAELQSFITKINGGVNLGDWNKFNLRLKEIENDMRVAGKLGKSLKQTLIEGAKSFAQWTLSSASVMEVVQAIKTTVRNVKELGNSLLELDKVSDLTVEGLEKVTDEAYKLGDTVGKTGKQVIDATTEFKRAGYDLQQSMDMAEAALVMTNVAEGITETSDAAGTLISVLKGFKMSDTEIMSVVDKMNQVSNTSPIGFDELADGLERVSGTMNQAGNTIDQTLGLLTGGYAQLRNIEKVSSGMIFIQQRLRGIDEDGNAIEGLSAKLKESFAEIGVNVENADGSLRSMYQIATDYAKVLPTLTSKQKQYYGELAAGNRQITVWNAITEQIADVEHATTQAMDSIGSASEENQKYLDSISGKVSKFESAVEDLSYSVLDSDLVKFFVDLGTLGVKAIDGLVDSLGGLGTIGLLGGVGLGFKNIGKEKIYSFKNCFEIADNNMCSLGY